MTSLAAGLPPEVVAQVHPDWHINEAAYWAARNGLLAAHRGRWIAFAGGRVLSSATSPIDVFQTAHASGLHPFVSRVRAEGEPCRMRRVRRPAKEVVVNP